MKQKTKARGSSETAALMVRLAAAIEGGVHIGARDLGPEAATASLLRHLSTKVAEDDLGAAVRFLSNALHLARDRMRRAEEAQLREDQSRDPSYWLG